MTLNIPLSFFEMLLFIFDHEMLVQQFKAGRSRNCICMFFVQRNSYSRAFVPVQMGVGVSTILVQKKKVQLTVLPFFCISNDNNKKQQKQKTMTTTLTTTTEMKNAQAQIILAA